ncbi:MAG: hypothetical protein J2P31_05910 [Blastocatellia bacterium]|nr:hypothetical protein [Blastocatellia bacterium]
MKNKEVKRAKKRQKRQKTCLIVELRYFGGLSLEETADALGISTTTAKREWTLAKAWLQREMERQ